MNVCSAVLILLSTVGTMSARVDAASSQQPQLYGNHVLERAVDMIGDGCTDFRWTVDRESMELTMALRSAPGADWVGLGISDNGGMKGADIAMIRRVGNHEFVVEDMFSRDFVRPVKDIMQNVELLFATIDEEDRIQAVVRRLADTCDEDDIAVTGSKQNLICASGSTNSDDDPLPHGRQRAKALVNLVVDENLLIERELQLDFLSTQTHVVEDVVVAHDVPETAKAPFAVDFQMPKITLDRTERTHYRCLVFEMPLDMNIVAFEAVWNNGTTIHDETPPQWLHHQNIRYCPQPDLIKAEHRNGQPFDCFHDIPACEVNVGHAQNGRLQTPAGVHLPLRKGGTYMLTVHYDNPYEAALDEDTSGIRVWVDPPTIESTSKPGQITYLRANFESIHIPADPEQKEVERQFMISSEATRAVLPPDGIQVFATHSHMHLAATRATAKLVRNGVHISNVFESKGYDFALQAPHWELWRLMPGDAIIMSCFYKPSPVRDIVGGWNTDDEMCDLIFGLAPEVKDFSYGVGWMVTPDEPFLNSFMGTAEVGAAKTIDYSQAIYQPNSEGRDYEPLNKHRKNLCDLGVRNTMGMAKVRWSSPQIPAQLYIIVTFCVTGLVSLILRAIGTIECERKKRNTIVYTVQLLFSSSIALPVIAWSLAIIFDPATTYDAVDHSTFPFARGLIVAQSILYLLELFYRIDIRPEVVIHHVLASLIVIFLNWVCIETLAFYVIFKLGLILTLMAVTEQPMYLALILKNLGYGGVTWWNPLCGFAGWSFIAIKLVLVTLGFVVMVQAHNGTESSWKVPSHSFAEWNTESARITSTTVIIVMSVALTALLTAQMFVGILLLKIAKGNSKERNQPQKLDDHGLRLTLMTQPTQSLALTTAGPDSTISEQDGEPLFSLNSLASNAA